MNTHLMNRYQRKRQLIAGISLIEVLVAMLVVSFGILAMSGLLANAGRYGKTSEFRGVATLLANDIADRMRANKPGVVNGSYTLTTAYSFDAPAPNASNACTELAPCAVDGADLAAKDLVDWRRAIFFNLPGGAGYLSVDTTNATNMAADVWVAWMDPSAVEETTAGADSGGATRDECPSAFVGNSDPKPRCVYFRVGL